MRPKIAFLIVSSLLAASSVSAVAQEAQTDAPTGPSGAPPAAVVVTPPAVVVAPATPQALVGKSIRDLSHGALGAALRDDVKALRRGPLLIHGNYCGIGNRPGTPPIDALDAACMRHDECTRTAKLPSCACDDRLRLDANEIAQDPRTPPELQVTAAATATAMAVLVCKYTQTP